MTARVSPAVYRRRRLVFFGAIVVILALLAGLVWFLVAQAQETSVPPPAGTSETPTPDASATTDTTATPTPGDSAPPDDGAVGPCMEGDVTVAAVTDSESYASDALPQMSISLTNRGARDCTIDVGTATQQFTVMSGADVWWRSTDCQQNPEGMIVTLAAGSTVTSSQPVVWDRTRSSPDTCASTERPRAPGGGASYHVSVSIGGFTSAESAQILLY